MRILGTVFFLSFLAGKLKSFERILLAENKKKLARTYFSKFFGGKLKFWTEFYLELSFIWIISNILINQSQTW